MDGNKVKMLIKGGPSTFVLGLTYAFAMGDEWIKKNIVDKEDRFTKDRITSVVMNEGDYSSTFTTHSSKIVIATGGTIIFWDHKYNMHKLYGGCNRKVIYLPEKI